MYDPQQGIQLIEHQVDKIHQQLRALLLRTQELTEDLELDLQQFYKDSVELSQSCQKVMSDLKNIEQQIEEREDQDAQRSGQ